MKIISFLGVAVFGAVALAALPAAAQEPVDFVNPFIGASTSAAAGNNSAGLGKTFPGATTPFGMTQVSPNTITGGDNGSGYSYEHTHIEGFALTQMSGVGWYGDLGNFLVTPSVGPLRTSSAGYRLPYDKKSEKATAGYYSVVLGDSVPVRAELTATPHCGLMRFWYTPGSGRRIQIDLARRVGGTSVLQYVHVVDDSTLEGWMKCTPEGGGWGDGAGRANYTVYFCSRFSKPLRHYGVWSADIPEGWGRRLGDVTSPRYQEVVAHAAVLPGVGEKEGKHLGFYTEFDTDKDEPVVLKTGISYVSIQGARGNLDAEVVGFDFDGARRRARAAWNKALSAVQVEGGSVDDKTCFYTALYHTLIDPRTCTDVDGGYPGGDGRRHQAAGFTKRTIFSGWDVFRSQMPLQTMINPGVVNDLINSLVTLAGENGTGYFDRWELLNAYSGCMVGNPAIAVVADAYVKGIRGFDIGRARQISVRTAERFGNGSRGFSGGENSISNTLEYAYSDWCLSRLMEGSDARKYELRGQDYKKVFDSAVGWFRPRNPDGSWQSWPDKGRLQEGYGTVESNPYQQGWFVPQDVPGMVALMGGRGKVLADLEAFFEKTPENMLWNEYYNHANEPVHHVAFLFDYLGAPWLTQQWSRAICRRAYHNSVEGLVGNDDVGQMSAWYVLAASGLYPICPGSTRYEITSPVFHEEVLRTGTGKVFRVLARNNSSSAIYIQSAKLNGKPYTKCHIDYREIMAGGVLELTMGDRPSLTWGK